MNKKSILFISPLIDLPTATSTLAVYDLIKYLLNKPQFDIDLLWGIGAKRPFYNLRVKEKKYDMIIYLGHGEKDRLMGNNLFFSLINPRNVGKLKGSIIATMACFSSEVLGRVAIQKGVRAYIGCKKEYMAFFPEIEHDFLDDWRIITESYFKALLDGRTAMAAFSEFQLMGKQYLQMYREHYHEGHYWWYFRALKHNLQNTELLGNPEAKLWD